MGIILYTTVVHDGRVLMRGGGGGGLLVRYINEL